MKNLYFLTFLIFFSCSIIDHINQGEKISHEIEKLFKLTKKDYDISIGWGEPTRVNRVFVTFYIRDLSSKSKGQLLEVVGNLTKEIKDKNPSFRKKHYLKVKFIEGVKDSMDYSKSISFIRSLK